MNEYVIKCGTLIDGTAKAPSQDAGILIKNRRIAGVEIGPKSS